MKSTIERFEAKTKLVGACTVWTGVRTSGGYGAFWLNGRYRRAHRAAWELFVGHIPTGQSVLHRCDNPLCVNPAHLFLGTRADNNRDMETKGRAVHPRGEDNGRARLTAHDARVIRQAFDGGVNKKQLARMFGVAPRTIGRVVSGENWSHA